MSRFSVKKNLRPVVKGKDRASFELNLVGDDLLMTFSTDNLLKIYNGKRTVFDAQGFKFSTPGEIGISLPANGQYRVFDQSGSRWSVGWEYDRFSLKNGFNEWVSTYSPLIHSLKKSVLAHIGCLLLGTSIYFLSKYSEQITNLLSSQTKVIKSIQQTIRISITQDRFKGVSLRTYESEWLSIHKPGVQAKVAVQSASKIMGLLKNSLSFSSKQEGSGDAKNGVPTLDTSSMVASNLQDLRNQEELNAAKKESAPKVSKLANEGSGAHFDRKEMLLRQAVSSFQPQLSRAFDEALRIDPSLNISLSYEGVINSQGRMVSIKLKEKGNGQPAAIEQLKKSVLQIFSTYSFSKECDGMLLRGEQLFAK